MKAIAAAAIASATLLQCVNAWKRVPNQELIHEDKTKKRTLFGGSDPRTEEHRQLWEFTVQFDECVGQTLEWCEAHIDHIVTNHPELFEGYESLAYEEHTVRQPYDENYYKVGLRVNMDETHVTGLMGDGMVFYPFPWCLSYNETSSTPTDCVDIGPWDCDVGTPLTVEQCCTMVTATVPDPDFNGNYLTCHTSYPVGSPSNPVDYHRVLIHVNDEGIVVHVPMNH